MERHYRSVLAAVAALLLSALLIGGCGGSDGPSTTTTLINSEYSLDGDVYATGGVAPFTKEFPPPAGTVAVGFSGGAEYVGILDFPLDTVPADAIIERAVLDMKYICPDSGVRMRLELIDMGTAGQVGYPGQALWDNTLGTLSPHDWMEFDLARVLVRTGVRIDVTPLMQAAQAAPPLARFQLRVALAGDSALGWVTIDDPATGRTALAPRLDVTYR